MTLKAYDNLSIPKKKLKKNLNKKTIYNVVTTMEDSIYKRAGKPLELPIHYRGCSLLHKIKSAFPRSRIPRPLLFMLSLPTVDPVSVTQISKLLITKPLHTTPFSTPTNPVPVSQISSIHALYATDNFSLSSINNC